MAFSRNSRPASARRSCRAHPSVYADLLRDYITRHKVDVWLVNSGWTGGKYGVGRRMPIKATRTLLTAALNGSLKDADFRTDPYFGFSVPTSVPGVEPHLLNPFKTWKDKAEFDKTARELVGMFQKNFAKFESTSRPTSRRRRLRCGSRRSNGLSRLRLSRSAIKIIKGGRDGRLLLFLAQIGAFRHRPSLPGTHRITLEESGELKNTADAGIGHFRTRGRP